MKTPDMLNLETEELLKPVTIILMMSMETLMDLMEQQGSHT
jgi:hypothetical protein